MTEVLFGEAALADEVKAAVPVLKDTSDKIIQALLVLVVDELLGSPMTNEVVSQTAQLPPPTFTLLFSALYSLIQACIRSRLASAKLEESLVQRGLPKNVVSVVITVVNKRRAALEAAVSSAGPKFPHLDDFRWRVDVTLSSNTVARAMRPSVLMQMTLSDGSVQTFEVSTDQFHQMRYSVAKVLQDVRHSAQMRTDHAGRGVRKGEGASD